MDMPRLHYLDNLRFILVVMVIFHHAALYAMFILHHTSRACSLSQLQSMVLDSTWQNMVMIVYVGLQQSFFMCMMFAISAYLMPNSYSRDRSAQFMMKKIKFLTCIKTEFGRQHLPSRRAF